MDAIVFAENQPFSQPLIWSVAAVLFGFMMVACIRQLILGKPVGSRPASNGVLIAVSILVCVLLPGFLLSSTMRIRLDSESLRVSVVHRLFPSLRLSVAEIAAAEAVTYAPLLQWGGWGYRANASGDRAYTLGGRRGVRIESKNGDVVLIGSSQPEILVSALRSLGVP